MATPSMMPQWSYMHIAGQDASEYLSPGLVQFARATDTYFSLGNKFRNPTVAVTCLWLHRGSEPQWGF